MLHFNTALYTNKTRQSKQDASLDGANAPDIPCACSGEPDKMTVIL